MSPILQFIGSLVAAAGTFFFLDRLLTRRPRKKPVVRFALIVSDPDDITSFFTEQDPMKKFSLATAYILISLVGLTAAGVTAAVDGEIGLVSTDPNVLLVTPLEGGLFKVEFVGVGEASLVARADADLSDGVREIEQRFDFLVYDQSQEADHFDFTILETHPRLEASVDTQGDTQADTGAAAAADPADAANESAGEDSV